MFTKTKFNLILLLLFLSLLSGCRVKEQQSFRTHYESLNLDTPEEAIQTFVQAFQQCDFVTVYMVLAPTTQQEVYKSQFNLYSLDFMMENLSPTEKEAIEHRIYNRLPLDKPEHTLDTLQIFDTTMLAAVEFSFLPFYIPDEIIILDAHRSETLLGQEALDLNARVEGVDGYLVFRLIQSPEQKWRVFQVIWPGGDENNFPWALSSTPIQKGQFNCQSDGSIIRTTYDRLNLSTPESTVQTFAEAFQVKDFPTVYWVLDSSAQFQWRMNLGSKRFEKLVAVDDPSFIWQTEWARRLLDFEELGLLSHDETFLALLGGVGGGTGDRESPYLPMAMEHFGSSSYMFDQIMLAANEQYLIDLGRSMTILETRIEDSNDGKKESVVTAAIEGYEEDITFRLRQLQSGRWRVLQVIVPGGDETVFPWSVP